MYLKGLFHTGLDSFAALNVMHYLSHLASIGHTIIASIHQPRPIIFDSFNKVAILSEGYQLYLGPPEGCVNWFQEHIKIPYLPERDGNVPDWVMDSVSVAFTKPLSVAQRYCFFTTAHLPLRMKVSQIKMSLRIQMLKSM